MEAGCSRLNSDSVGCLNPMRQHLENLAGDNPDGGVCVCVCAKACSGFGHSARTTTTTLPYGSRGNLEERRWRYDHSVSYI